MKKMYISGKITGMEWGECVRKFKSAELYAEAMHYKPLNPTLLKQFDLSYSEYMRIDEILIESADVILMLDNWQTSNGARKELEYAKQLGKEIWYQDNSTATV